MTKEQAIQANGGTDDMEDEIIELQLIVTRMTSGRRLNTRSGKEGLGCASHDDHKCHERAQFCQAGCR